MIDSFVTHQNFLDLSHIRMLCLAGMLKFHGLFIDVQSPLIKVFGLGILPLHKGEASQVGLFLSD